jgi:hypothetical protein
MWSRNKYHSGQGKSIRTAHQGTNVRTMMKHRGKRCCECIIIHLLYTGANAKGSSQFPCRGIKVAVVKNSPRHNESVVIIMPSRECSLGKKRNLPIHHIIQSPPRITTRHYTHYSIERGPWVRRKGKALRAGAKQQYQHQRRRECR